MSRLLSLLTLSFLIAPAHADHFEHYINPVLDKAIQDGKNVKEHKELTAGQIAEMGEVLADTADTFLIVRTNEDRWANCSFSRPGNASARINNRPCF